MHYDFIIAGGGVSGLSLACHLIHSPLRNRSILIVDQDANGRDCTWGFWTDQPTLFDAIVHHSWHQLHVAGENFEKTINLGNYIYRAIRGDAFFRYARQELSAYPNVTFLQGVVKQIDDTAEGGCVTVEDQAYLGNWIFDSLHKPQFQPAHFPAPYHRGLPLGQRRYHHLQLRFQGWEVETPRPAFNPQAITFFDFRTPQNQDVRFFYVLPYSEYRGLVMYTLFTKAPGSQVECEQAMKVYLQSARGVPDYTILHRESGVIPITDRPYPRQIGQHIMTVGTKGGRVKPSTGYAFTRIQRDSAAIVHSLLHTGEPFNIPRDSLRYRWCDSLLLEIMSKHGEQIQSIFTAIFKHNSIERIYCFLDEKSSLGENLRALPTLPLIPFAKASLTGIFG